MTHQAAQQCWTQNDLIMQIAQQPDSVAKMFD